jgi:hypothetical protein
MKIALLILPILMLAVTAQANDDSHSKGSKYAGEEKRSIKSLSPDDIAELKRGGGWGLAKAAELNGVPGPAHLLEMKDKIPLTKDQVMAINKTYKQMKAQAIKQGEHLIVLEQELELQFRSGSITPDALRASLIKIANVRMELRFTHLAAHLKTPDILSKDQIRKYNELRGYSNPDPCANIPDGHNAEMWRKHNGCK